jgi:hypothetical protein
MQTKKSQILYILIFFGILRVAGQTAIQIKDSTYIFWSDGIEIKYEDYKGPTFPNTIPVIAEIAIWTALDIPDSDESPFLPILFYIAPVFDRSTSHADTNDQALIDVNNIYFNISEICARTARKKMSTALDTLKLNADVSTSFKTIVKEMHEQRLRLNRKFHREYFRDKNPNAINIWNTQTNDELKMLFNWATTSTDIQRFMYAVPLEKSYKEDLSCNPKLLHDKYEQTLSPNTWHAGFNQISRFGIKRN